jgi:membrane protease YdiL (CAAX protease family)
MPPVRSRTTYWVGAALLAAVALAVSAVTVGADHVGACLAIGSLSLALCWAALAAWAGTGVRWWPTSTTGWAWTAAIAAGCSVAFLGGAALFLHVGWLADEIGSLTGRAEQTSVMATWVFAVIAGSAEEAVFRGSAYTWLRGRWPVVTSTLVYAAAMAVTGQIALVLAALGVGLACALARALTGSLAAPMIVHAVWTTSMLAALPHLT